MTVYLIRTQRGGFHTDAVYTSPARAEEAAALLPPALGWVRIVPRPLLADGEAAPEPEPAPAAEAAPLSMSVVATGHVGNASVTAPSGEVR